MPTYSFRNKTTGEIFDRLMNWSARNSFLEENSNFEPVLMGAPSLGDPVRLGIRTTDNGFKEVLSKIGEKNYKSNLRDKLSRR